MATGFLFVFQLRDKQTKIFFSIELFEQRLEAEFENFLMGKTCPPVIETSVAQTFIRDDCSHSHISRSRYSTDS